MQLNLIKGLALASALAAPAAAAPLNTADALFKYVDSSCTKNIDGVNNAVKDMNTLVEAAEKGLAAMTNDKGSNEVAFDQWFGVLRDDHDRVTNAKDVAAKYKQLGGNIVPKTLSLYCDGSAFKFVTTEQEGSQKGQEFADKKGGRWYIPPDRRAKDETNPTYIIGTKRDDFCVVQGKEVTGVSAPGIPIVAICPNAFKAPLKSLPDQPTEQKPGTLLGLLETPGGTLLHETTHAVLKTSAKETYGFRPTRLLAEGPGGGFKAFRNADNYVFYAMTAFFNKNDWTLGLATTPFKAPAPAPAPAAEQQTPAPTRMLRRVVDFFTNALAPRKGGGGGGGRGGGSSGGRGGSSSGGRAGGSTGTKPSRGSSGPKPSSKGSSPPASSKVAAPPASSKSAAPSSKAPQSSRSSSSSASSSASSGSSSGSVSSASSSASVSRPQSSSAGVTSPSASGPTTLATTARPTTSSLTSTTNSTSILPTTTGRVSDIIGSEAINFATTDPAPNAAESSANAAFLATIYAKVPASSGTPASSGAPAPSGTAASAAAASAAKRDATPTTLMRVIR